MSLNKVQIIGNLGTDPRINYKPNGECVANFPIATSEKWISNQTGQKMEHTEWHQVAAFHELAEICCKYLKKGALIYCEGKLRTNKYIDRNNIEKFSTKIVIDSMQILGKKGDERE